MWIITKRGFVSLVQHNEYDDYLRARARRREHLVDTFCLEAHEVIDYGPDVADYRWHANVPRYRVVEAMLDAMAEIDYDTDAKGNMAGGDDGMHQVLLKVWSDLLALQVGAQSYEVMEAIRRLEDVL